VKYLLNSDICIYLINGKSGKILKRMTAKDPNEVCISSVTLFELTYGVEKSRQVERNKLALAHFCASLNILAFDDRAAQEAGVVRADLEKVGKTIGAYDVMIGAHARSIGATVVTNNTKEFKHIQSLKVENWT